MSHPLFDITGKKVLCVGAGRGIGKGIALAFAEAGADVAVTGVTLGNAGKVAEQIKSLGRQGFALAGDATKAADMERVAEQAIAALGRVDVLVNCVGDAIRKPVAQLPGNTLPGMSQAEWHQIVDINLTQAFMGCRALGPHMLNRREGSVINVSGWAAFRGRPLSAAYDAAKAGVMRFTECLAQEWAPHGVRVNSIAPGQYPDPAQMSAEAYQRRQDEAKKYVPLGRVGDLKEPGYLAVFLASPAAAYITGQTWAVDGGLAIKHP